MTSNAGTSNAGTSNARTSNAGTSNAGTSNAGTSNAKTSIGIVDLVDLCDEQYATHLGWFAVLGRRVRDEPDPRLQRWFATAAHRHAWHAELWAQRRPAIPHDVAHQLPEPTMVEVGDDIAAAYRDHLVEQRGVLDRLRGTIDPELDPSTQRVIDLVDADLADLAAHW